MLLLKSALTFVLMMSLFHDSMQQYGLQQPTNAPPIDNGGSVLPENLINGIPFDCSNKPTGFYRDTRYCDVFHVCVGYQQRKTYGCPQVGDRFYYDENLKRCEFASKNPAGCQSNAYYQQQMQPPVAPTNMPYPPDANAIVEPWKLFVRQNEQFSCAGKSEGFYPSRWCNVFYRCFIGIKYEFLCAKQTNNDRLWWTQHSTSQSVPQMSAQCAFPCDLKRQCTSPGGILIDNGNSVSESTAEANRALSNCNSHGPVIEDNSNDQFRLPDNENTCVGAPEGSFQADNKYCNIFHVCISGKRKDFLCAKASNGQYELWWNDATKRCEWPCKVQCNKQVFGGARQAAEIQNIDRNINAADCAPNNNNNNNNNYNINTVAPVIPGYGK